MHNWPSAEFCSQKSLHPTGQLLNQWLTQTHLRRKVISHCVKHYVMYLVILISFLQRISKSLESKGKWVVIQVLCKQCLNFDSSLLTGQQKEQLQCATKILNYLNWIWFFWMLCNVIIKFGKFSIQNKKFNKRYHFCFPEITFMIS